MRHLLEIYCVQLNNRIITSGLSYKHENRGHENQYTLELHEVDGGNLL